ncbi:hypothetical protein ACQ4PT_009693 [Festuca glaucescens]
MCRRRPRCRGSRSSSPRWRRCGSSSQCCSTYVLLYEGADMPPFEDILQSLRSSLAVTLGSFAPLAGKLVHLKDTGDVAISCSASHSVKFVVAESDTGVRRLARDEEHDLPVLEQVVPDVDMSELPTAVLAVQATRF